MQKQQPLSTGWFKIAAESDREIPADPGLHDGKPVNPPPTDSHKPGPAAPKPAPAPAVKPPVLPAVETAPGTGPFAVFPSRTGYRLLYVPADGGPAVDLDGLTAPALRQLRILLDGIIPGK
ncbi:MAG: hypothetical protein ACRC7O_18475 [Fimbriiglobus sp.]